MKGMSKCGRKLTKDFEDQSALTVGKECFIKEKKIVFSFYTQNSHRLCFEVNDIEEEKRKQF